MEAVHVHKDLGRRKRGGVDENWKRFQAEAMESRSHLAVHAARLRSVQRGSGAVRGGIGQLDESAEVECALGQKKHVRLAKGSEWCGKRLVAIARE